MRRAQQVTGLGDPLWIMCLLKKGECLLVVVQRDARLFDVHMPIAQAVETVSQREWIAQVTGQRQRLLIIAPCLGVVALCPKKPQVHQGLPFCMALSSF